MSALTDFYEEIVATKEEINNIDDDEGPVSLQDMLLLSIAHRLFDIAQILEDIRTRGLP